MNPVFHKTINKDSIDYLQKKEKYAEAMQTYVDGSIDSNNEDLRKMKTCLYGILSSFMMYNPVLKRNLSSFRDGLDVTPLISIEKEDPMYGEKMQAALLVLYYCIKNRSFNYAISSNASV